MKSDVIPPEVLSAEDEKYMRGKENKLIRFYFYCNRGLDIVNQFRNLVLGIFAIYFTLKLTNPVWLIVLFVPSVIIITILGRYSVHRMQKLMDWVGVRFSTHFGIRQFNYSKMQAELLEEILLELKETRNFREKNRTH